LFKTGELQIGKDHEGREIRLTENEQTPARLRPKLMSFDVFGTLISVRASSYGAFERILANSGAHHPDVKTFWEHWEHRNIAHYWEPYRSYRDICELSLAETFAHFEIRGDSRLIAYYFEAFPGFLLYDDVVRTLDRLSRRYKLAVVSNIDDDLLALTPLKRNFDLVCTAQRAKGYKPDGTLFRYLIENAGVAKDEILHSGQSQFTDLVGGKPLGLTIAWINRRQIALDDSVPRPDFICPDIQSVGDLVE
jgi:2-haloacid dehalogenase